MGYNISRNSVIRNRPQLEELLRVKKTVIIPHVNPKRLASKLWEAIRSAEQFEEFNEYAEVGKLYRFRAVATGLLCDYIAESAEAFKVVVPVEKGEAKEQEVIKTVTKIPERIDLPEATGLLEVIALAVRFSDHPEIRFPNAVLKLKDQRRLYDWTQQDDVEWKYISHDEAGLTLTKNDAPEEILWRPEQ